MKLRSLSSLSCISVLALVGCTSLTGDRPYTPPDLQSDVQAVVESAALVRLSQHPDRRPAWVRAEAALGVLVSHEDWDLNSFTTAFLVGTADRVQNEKVVISIQAGVLAITTLAKGRVDLKDPVWAKAAITGAHDGIEAALKAIPPPPPES